MEKAVELRADKLLAVSKRRDVERKKGWWWWCRVRGQVEDVVATGIWLLSLSAGPVLDSRQVFVEAQSELLEGARRRHTFSAIWKRGQKSALLHTSHPRQP
jgi:hypothetical protein